MSALLADVGLNIREAHVFSTTDGYSLDVFVVDGWPTEVRELKLSLFWLSCALVFKHFIMSFVMCTYLIDHIDKFSRDVKLGERVFYAL
jgi:hypothetical protein